MSNFVPRQTRDGAEPDAGGEQPDAPLPTRFGRDGRRRWLTRQPKAGVDRPEGAPRAAPDDERPFDDNGAL